MWMEFNGNGIWNKVPWDKYLCKKSLSDWIKKGEHSVVNTSLI